MELVKVAGPTRIDTDHGGNPRRHQPTGRPGEIHGLPYSLTLVVGDMPVVLLSKSRLFFKVGA